MLRKKGLELFRMVDPVDEYCVQRLMGFDGKKLKSTTKECLELEVEEQKLDELKATLMKEVLGDMAEKVAVSSRMAEASKMEGVV